MSPSAAPAHDDVLVAKSDLAGLAAIFVFGKDVRWRLALALGTIVAATSAVMVAARVLGTLVERLAAGATAADVWTLGLVFLALEAAAVGGQYLGRVALARATIEITYQIRLQLFRKMRRVPISYFDREPVGRTITRLTADVEGIETFFGGTLARVLTAFITIAIVLVAMLVTAPAFGAIVVAACLPSLLFSIALRAPVRDSLRLYKQRAAHVNAKLAEYLSGLPVIRIFGLEHWTQRSYAAATESMYRAGVTTMNWNSFIRPMTVLLCSIPTLLILWLGGRQVIEGLLPLGTLIAFVRFSERFVSPIRTISQEIQHVQEALVSSERVRRMLGEPEEETTLGPDGTLRAPLVGRVEYQDVRLTYPGGHEALKGVSFVATPGMKVGLVGASGSGKTSTVNLLPRLYPASGGRVLVDGHDLRDYDRDAFRSQLGYVAQDVVAFSGTLRDNLLCAVPERAVSDEELWEACRKTGLAEVLRGLREGLDHRVVEGGDNLSMGERQLIAFTRMLLRDPRILILDEATANIDERCERLIQKATDELMRGRTCFVIAHRLSTIVRCDLILVFKDGRIVEQGTHAELVARGGAYAALAGRQLLA